jgi:hypothetical protein
MILSKRDPVPKTAPLATVLGIQVLVDPAMSPTVVELRSPHGNVRMIDVGAESNTPNT